MTARVETSRPASNPSGSSHESYPSRPHSGGPSTPGLRLNLNDIEPNHIRPHQHKRQLSKSETGFLDAGHSPPFSETVASSQKITDVHLKGAPRSEEKQDEKAGHTLVHPEFENRSPSRSSVSKIDRPGMTHSTSSPQLSSTRRLSDSSKTGHNSSIPPPCDARKHRHHIPPTISVGASLSPSRSGSSSGGVLVSTVRDRANRGQGSRGPARSDSLNDLKGVTRSRESVDEPDWRMREANESALDDDYRDLDNR